MQINMQHEVLTTTDQTTLTIHELFLTSLLAIAGDCFAPKIGCGGFTPSANVLSTRDHICSVVSSIPPKLLGWLCVIYVGMYWVPMISSTCQVQSMLRQSNLPDEGQKVALVVRLVRKMCGMDPLPVDVVLIEALEAKQKAKALQQEREKQERHRMEQEDRETERKVNPRSVRRADNWEKADGPERARRERQYMAKEDRPSDVSRRFLLWLWLLIHTGICARPSSASPATQQHSNSSTKKKKTNSLHNSC